ncbi:glycoside hydrolase family 88/105 protein [Litchfieldia salsa]|uniref:Unsaturated rhamnogalacturonyl hydrolase n=1 Tax=Litchfieldia salsa TaxID=930152 RepID=A0A1H0PSD0_9BACI|nr:glycoside hydrolase family 105 protein [Litchfieldia salsa]SDP07565.1 unsaturated rhamnogalacturonyl hydrolase [Litchfieldia salsa]
MGERVEVTTPLYWAEKLCDTLMTKFTPEELPPASSWHYHQGVFLCGMMRVWEKTKNDQYFQYVKKYVDNLIDEHGNFYFRRDELDSIQAGLLLYPLYKKTGEAKYKIAAEKLRNLYNTINKTSEGGFWHKDKYPYQMWLDGLYMGGPFALHYASEFNEPELVDMVIHQEALMRKHTKDEKTGLYYHGWDELGETPWAKAETNTAPEFWGRALGWYGLAVIDMIDLLPEDHPKRLEWIGVIQDLVVSLTKFQDKDTGLWYQVVDKGSYEGNWLESSASCLFLYTIAKAVNKQYVNAELAEVVKKGFQGLIENKIEEKDQSVVIKDICIGTSIGVFDYYITRERSENDLHGAGAFILACMEIEKLFS